MKIGRWVGAAVAVVGFSLLAAWWYQDSGPDPMSARLESAAPVTTSAPLGEGQPTPGGVDPSGAGPFAVGDPPPDRDAALDLYRRGRLDEAAAALVAYLEARPDDAEAAAALAQVQWLRGETESSSARYEAVLAQHGEDPETLYQLALVLRTDGRLGDAVEALDAALTLRPLATEFRLELARTLRMAGGYARAAREWAAVMAALPPSDPALAGCYYELGLTYVAAGDTAAARDAFERGAALRPGDPAFAAQLDALAAGGMGS